MLAPMYVANSEVGVCQSSGRIGSQSLCSQSWIEGLGFILSSLNFGIKGLGLILGPSNFGIEGLGLILGSSNFGIGGSGLILPSDT